MKNYKVRVNNEAESKEAQELFFELGATLGNGDHHAVMVPGICGIANIAGEINFIFNESVFIDIIAKELTFPKLRDLVVLKRNNVNDATHEDNGHRYYTASNGNLYGFMNGKWLQFDGCKSPTFTQIKKSETMKEYLNEKYELITAPESEAKEPHAKGWLKVPEGSGAYCQYRKGEDDNEFFLKKIGDTYYFANKESCYSWGWYGFELKGHEFVLWQRNAPAVSDEVNKSSKLKSVSETLKERQQQYGCFEDVAMVTRKIMDAIEWARGKDKLPEPHHEALHMIASKIARIVNGDCNHKDSWHDIGGYAKLIEDLIGDTEDDIPF